MNESSSDIERVVIVGAGLTAISAATELRGSGYERAITIIGNEGHRPYDRPPLSKSFMTGEATIESTELRPEDWYRDNGIDLVTGRAVTELDRTGRRIKAGDASFDYDRLVLAMGSRARRLPLAERSGVDARYLRTLDDAVGIGARLDGRLAIIGGGWIGLELAAAARAAGGEVVVIEASALPLSRVLGPEIAEVFLDLHRSHGVDVRTEATVEGMRPGADGAEVTLSDGSKVEADTVVVAIGAEPNVDLARSAGLACTNGIDVDARLRTSDPMVFAAGDVANHDHPLLGPVRVEHWDNAMAQGRHVAGSLLGDGTPYTALPYFFTDQYDLGMEYIGHPGAAGYDDIRIFGDLTKRTFSAFWLRDSEIVAGMHCGLWDEMDLIRELVGGPAAALDA